jgi:hypothetical protein
LAELSASDRAAAEKQRVCPVSGDVLGATGKPYKVTVKGQTVFLCCPDGRGKFSGQRGLAPFAAERPEGCFAQTVPVPFAARIALLPHFLRKRP